MKILPLFFSILLLSCSFEKKEVQHEEATSFPQYAFKDSTFAPFYNQFISDSAFQITHTKFPISGSYNSYEEERKWSKEQWPMMRWDLRNELENMKESYTIADQDSIVLNEENGKLFFGIYCLNCGFSFEMEFEKIAEEWYLIYRQENNF
ncbi:hypothetical protein [Flammeovirga sp. SJP92]|uniref:hypothetical protein n=1 Tax=Flammeovirga sp. SJP92 TaxID=1775430 RepID=UPI00078836B7|nr:hypothetical protein [Flammeovirga sp. SJP92]KXX68229.1 hypothetical protein AVL50_20765 [Flammeovirga sp. SJP92]